LNPRISKSRWTHQEDQKLMELFKGRNDHSWAKIAAALGNRTDVQVRYRYRKLLKMAKLIQTPGTQEEIPPVFQLMNEVRPTVTAYAIVPANVSFVMTSGPALVTPIITRPAVPMGVPIVGLPPPQQHVMRPRPRVPPSPAAQKLDKFLSFFV
jgi:Asp-tRNA(Asn)/Glu-tRNA(Gln) amidotransferase A subunit family amidase